MKSKLNKCAHCASRNDLQATFDKDGRLYFICRTHKMILDALIADAAKLGIAL